MRDGERIAVLEDISPNRVPAASRLGAFPLRLVWDVHEKGVERKLEVAERVTDWF